MRLSRSEPGLAVSAALHAGLLLAALVAFSDAKKFEDAQEAVAVDMVSDSQFNQIMKGEKTAKEIKTAQRADKAAETSETRPLPPLAEAKKDVAAPPPPVKRREAETDDKPEAPPPPKRVAALPPAPEPPARPVSQPPAPPVKPQAKAAPEPEPEKDEPEDAEVVKQKPPVRPKLEKAKDAPQPPEKPKPKDEPRLKTDEVAKLLEQKKLADKATASKSKEDKKSDKPPAKPRSGDETAPKSKFNAASIASLLSHEAPQRRASTGKELTRTAALGAPTANAPRMSPTLQAQIDAYTVEHYRKCWQASLSMNARSYIPRVEFRLTRDGALDGSPRLLNPSSEPVERSRGEQALGAVRRCSPMPIPAAFAPYYDYWRVTALDMREDM